MTFSRLAELIIREHFKNLTVGLLPRKRVLTICGAFGGQMVFIARPVAGIVPGQVPEACCAAQRASTKRRLLPERSSRRRGNPFALGFKLCGS